MTGKIIEIQNLTRTYVLGEVEIHALRGISLTIECGEFVAIMGASGSGKSTLMNIIGCLDRPTSGRYLLEGVDVASLDDEALANIRGRRIGFVFQNFNLLSRTSALENVELPLFYSGWNSESERRAHELLEMVGLGGRETNHPNQLSGGQQQRVAIARALINRPAILLADEPTGNLDTHNAGEIMEILRHLNREQGVTIVLVTHESEIAAFADRVVTLRDGEVLSDHLTSDHQPVAFEPAAESTQSLGGDNLWSFAAMAFNAAARALRRNKMRSALTMLGIFIGVAAVIAMVAVGQGASASVKAQIQSLGTNLLIVLPGATTSNGVRAGYGTTSTLTVTDAEAIRKEDPAVAVTSYLDRQVAQVVNANKNWSTSINGVTASYFELRDWAVVSGRAFSEEEQRSANGVCLLGQTVVTNLFGENQDPVGAIIRVKNVPLRVLGTLAIKGQSNWGQDQDDVVLMPFETAERKVLGVAAASSAPAANSAFNSTTVRTGVFGGSPKIMGVVNQIYAKAINSDEIDSAQQQIEQTLRRRHHIRAGQDADFTVRSLTEIARASEDTSRIMTLLLAAVASISLLVGGIGIMNILLVSVTERTREIGIRMAIGARRIHILLQFLVEAVFLSALGGIAGVILGIAASKLISILAEWPILLSPVAISGGFLFSAAVGIFFGYYPAHKASMLDPIEALRYE
jgi:macrolide transport system ATP-binding/permease protein